MDLADLPLMEAAARIASREISSAELTRACLARIESLDSLLNSFITLTADLALDQARAADQVIRRGDARGRLLGVPLALKDLFVTRGVRTTAGSSFLSGFVPSVDACVVSKLKAQGAVLLGKLNMHEWAFGVTNDNPHFGPCRNPWDPARISGGSSGGAGAALAAGLCPGALGSDTGGSIRIPASLCGVVGLKPTYGRVSLRGVIPLSWNLDHVGPMARRVEGVAILLQVIAGHDPQDPYSVQVPGGDYLTGLEAGVVGWRVGLVSDGHFTPAEAGVLAAVREAVRVFEALGAHVEPVALEAGKQALENNVVMLVSDAAALHQARLRRAPEKFGDDVRTRLQRGAALTAPDYARARRWQRWLQHRFLTYFEAFDILLTPATPVTAPLLAGGDALGRAHQLTRFTAPFNLTGLPALSLPCGFVEGLPVGLQIVARPWDEARLLRAAFAYQQATGWHLRSPTPGDGLAREWAGPS